VKEVARVTGKAPRRIDWRRPMLPGDGPLARVHPVVAFLVVLAVFLGGIWWGGLPGALLLGVLAVAVAVLLAATWPRLSAPERAIRLLVVLALVAIALQVWR
jgi:predicted neutral ceramidase superfamily lipid hydrolase